MGHDLDAWIDLSRAAGALAAALAALAWIARSPRALRFSAVGAFTAALAAGVALLRLGLRQDGVPLLQPADMGLASALLLLACAAAFVWRTQREAVRARAPFLIVAALLAVPAAGLFGDAHSIVAERAPALRTIWMPVHVAAWCVAIAAASAAALARLSDRGASAARFAERSSALSFAAVTLGLFSGSIWSLQAWSALWSWDPKSILALAAWALLGFHALARDTEGAAARWRSRAPAMAAVVMLFNLLGWGYLPGAQRNLLHGPWGLHSTSRGVEFVEAPLRAPPEPEYPFENGPASFPLHTR